MTCHYRGCLHVALKRRTVPRKAENRVCVFSKGVLPTAASTPPLPPPPATVTLVLGLICDLKPTKPTKPTFLFRHETDETDERDVLSTAALADSMQAFLPEGLSALSSIVRNWTFSLFYLMSELWGSVVVSVLVSRRRHGGERGKSGFFFVCRVLCHGSQRARTMRATYMFASATTQ